MSTASPRSGVSIRFRLALWYGLTLLAILFGVVAVLRLQLRRTLEREFSRSLEQSGRLVQQFFALEIAEYHDIETTLTHITAEAVFPERLISFRRPTGEPYAAAITNSLARSTVLLPPVRSLSLELDSIRAPGWTVEIRTSAAEMELARSDFDAFLLVIVPMLTLIAGASGWWLTGRTLRPVQAMAEAADAIAASGGSGRLPLANPNDELGRLGARFNLLLDQLAAALAQQRRFLADAAHELRTPIARMRSAVDLAQLTSPGPTDRATIAELGGDLERTSLLLGELLQLARADADPHEVQLAPLYLDDAIIDALVPWRSPARRADVTLTTSALDEAPIMGDATLLARLIGILVDNAIRYTPAGGLIDVRVRRAGEDALIEVADTGIGMSAEDRARALDRFYRGAAARQLAPEGSGLGLPIAAWIVERHGGLLDFDSANPTGIIVRVTIPVRIPEHAPAA